MPEKKPKYIITDTIWNKQQIVINIYLLDKPSKKCVCK